MASHTHYESDNEDDLLSFGGPPQSASYGSQAYGRPSPDPSSSRVLTPTYTLDDGFNSADYGGGRSANQDGPANGVDGMYFDDSEY
jgi:hypothetical protein